MGPRQITGVSSGTKWPIEITFTPWDSSGMIMLTKPTGLPSALLIAHRGQGDFDALDAGDRLNGRGHVGRDPVPQGAAFDREQDVNANEPAIDLDPLQHPDVFDRFTDLGIPNASERLADLLFGGHRRSSPRYDSRICTVRTVQMESTTGEPSCQSRSRSRCTRRSPRTRGTACTDTSGSRVARSPSASWRPVCRCTRTPCARISGASRRSASWRGSPAGPRRPSA